MDEITWKPKTPDHPRAFQVEWDGRVWAISAMSQNGAKADAMTKLRVLFPGKTIRYFPDVRVRRWEGLDLWAKEAPVGMMIDEETAASTLAAIQDVMTPP